MRHLAKRRLLQVDAAARSNQPVNMTTLISFGEAPAVLLCLLQLSLRICTLFPLSLAVISFLALTISADVDGTLIRSIGEDANKLHKLAFAEVLS